MKCSESLCLDTPKLMNFRSPSATTGRFIEPFPFSLGSSSPLVSGGIRSLCISQSKKTSLSRAREWLQFTSRYRDPLGQGVLDSKHARTQTSSGYLTDSSCCKTLTQWEVRSLLPAR